jgi:tetratricopeptide (TPR) repeat protein
MIFDREVVCVMQNEDIKTLLYQSRLLVEEGRYNAAQTILETIHPEVEKQRQDVAYLLGWCHVQRKQWVEALRTLVPLLKEKNKHFEIEIAQEREQHTFALLLLGLAAVNLASYEDASHHFTRCLKVLHDRRVHLPVVRIYARYYLARTCQMRGLYSAAIQHYDEALRLCHHYHDEQVQPDIYRGLCDVYRYSRNLTKAYLAGKEALDLYKAMPDRQMEACMHNRLGRVCFLLSDYQSASEHYAESFAIATSVNDPTMLMMSSAALAEVRMTEERLEEARHYCKLALSAMEHTNDIHRQGRVYHVIGKVTHEGSRLSSGYSKQVLLEEAATWYEKANMYLRKTQAYRGMDELYGGWAQVLEELGRVSEAIDCWRAGYAVLHHTLKDGS